MNTTAIEDIETDAQHAGSILTDVERLARHMSMYSDDDADAAFAALRLIAMACEQAHHHCEEVEKAAMQLKYCDDTPAAVGHYRGLDNQEISQ